MKQFIISMLFLSVILAGCTPTRITRDYNREIDFKRYKDFYICNGSAPTQHQLDTEKNREMIQESISKELLKLGYTKEEAGPDLMVSYHVVFEDKSMLISDCKDDQGISTWPDCRIETYTYTEGTIVISILDNSASQLIWHGSIQAEWPVNTMRIKGAVTRRIKLLFGDFPGEVVQPELTEDPEHKD